MNIIVTGAGKGIGYETVLAFSEIPDARVVAISRSVDRLIALNRPNILPLSFDLEKTNDFDQILSFLKRNSIEEVSIIVNNAGLLINKPFKNTNMADIQKIFQINVFSVFLLTQKLLPILTQSSHIVNISSMGGFQGSIKFPGLSAYSASKGALAVLTECMAEELKECNVHVNCLALGAVQTEMLSLAFPDYVAPNSAKEMGAFICDFASNGNKFFNGKIIPVSVSTP